MLDGTSLMEIMCAKPCAEAAYANEANAIAIAHSSRHGVSEHEINRHRQAANQNMHSEAAPDGWICAVGDIDIDDAASRYCRGIGDHASFAVESSSRRGRVIVGARCIKPMRSKLATCLRATRQPRHASFSPKRQHQEMLIAYRDITQGLRVRRYSGESIATI